MSPQWAAAGWRSLASNSKEVDDIAYEVDCQMILVKEGEVDIGTL